MAPRFFAYFKKKENDKVRELEARLAKLEEDMLELQSVSKYNVDYITCVNDRFKTYKSSVDSLRDKFGGLIKHVQEFEANNKTRAINMSKNLSSTIMTITTLRKDISSIYETLQKNENTIASIAKAYYELLNILDSLKANSPKNDNMFALPSSRKDNDGGVN